ncbi:MAG TPA: lyase family protein [Phycisphaerales bacterium]|nr:lyase family protein [Phycisphaerales bacterium]
MTSPYDTYSSPLAARNASPEMLRLWSPRHKFNTWRRIWLAVAEAQHELGGWSGTSGTAPSVPLVSKEQVAELRAVVTREGGITDAEMHAAEKYERDLRHDVMAHVHALGDSCPKAKGIIHLGMTSQDVVCNADFATLYQAVDLIRTKIARLISSLADHAAKHARAPALGFTHYQPAQPVTVGRRTAMWASDLRLTLERLDGLHPYHGALIGSLFGILRPRGFRGATGTQASFLALIGDPARVDAFERASLERAMDGVLPGFQRNLIVPPGEFVDHPAGVSEPQASVPGDDGYSREAQFDFSMLTGQTYPRVIDAFILSDLAATASVLHKIATDIRLLANRKELDEPFETNQIGSSAMPYKRNPMRCERICGLARFVMNLVGNAYDTAATQWLERTLDDSSNRRLSLPEAFLALDGALDLMHNVASGLIVHEAMVKKNLMAELPFMATENILMACVKAGGDRQHYHELIRVHAQAAGSRVKDEGLDNDLLDRLQQDPVFHTPALKTELDWSGLLDPMKYIGRSIEQTERFITEVVEPLRAQYGEAIARLNTTGPRV